MMTATKMNVAMTKASPQKGLTLVELLIAMGIFALISASSVTLLALASRAENHVVDVSAELSTLERARAIIRNDAIQIANRPYREPSRTKPIPAFLGGEAALDALSPKDNERFLFAFVHYGWSNPNAIEPRASVQHVLYLVRDDQLIRRTRPFVDAALETPSSERVLFEKVEDVTVQFLNEQIWQENWVAEPRRLAPAAIRIRMTHPLYGDLVQDFLSGGAS